MPSYVVMRHTFTVATGMSEHEQVQRPVTKVKAQTMRDKLNDQQVKVNPTPENEGKIVSFSIRPAGSVRARSLNG